MSPADSPVTSPDAHIPTDIEVAGPPTMPPCEMLVPAQSVHRMPTAVAPSGEDWVGVPYAITFVNVGDAPSMKIAIPVPPELGCARYVPLMMVGDAGVLPVWRMCTPYEVCALMYTPSVTVRSFSIGDASVTVSADETSENRPPAPLMVRPSRLVAAVAPEGIFTPSGDRPVTAVTLALGSRVHVPQS